MYLALIVLPILGSIVSGFFGRKVGVSGSHIITCTCVISTTILAILAFIEVGLNNIPVRIHLFRWIDAEYLNVSWAFNFDSLTVSMLIPVLIVSSLVHVYSIGYMSHDPHNQRFFSYLSLFTFMMIILVTGDNFLVMFVGWEGVGVCSYLLVSFWFTRIAANQSSLAAFLTNRVGDCVLTIGMFAILWSFGNVDYTTVFSLAPFYSENIIIFIGVCLLVGAMAKSSQVGLHIWLPMAMEGPTPVSALIHAATMVTAGVYLLMRASPLIEYSSTVLLLCLWVGAITTVFSSLVGLFQQDIKKVIAYSTMSQLGMMVIAIGLSSYNVALFHLVNHAFYKGLLFLGAGSVIHAVADNQDFRKYGGLISYMPLTYSVMLIASLSLVAFPFMTGFYSKDFILESAYGQYHLSGIIVYFVATIGAMFTTLYSVKVLYLTFLSNPNGPIINYKPEKGAHEGDIFMSMPLIILAVFSIFFGYITKDIFIGMGSDFFSDNGLYIHPSHEKLLDTEFAVNTLYKLLPLFFTISLTMVSLLFTEFFPKNLIRFKFSRLGYNIFSFFNQRFLVEMYYNRYVSGQILKLGSHTTKILDKGAVEIFGPHGLEKKLTEISSSINSLSTGIVTSYALYILIGLIFYISLIYLSNTPKDYLDLIIVLYALISVNQFNTKISANNSSKEKALFNVMATIKKLKQNIYKNNKIINNKTLFRVIWNLITILILYMCMGFFSDRPSILLLRFILLFAMFIIFIALFNKNTSVDEISTFFLRLFVGRFVYLLNDYFSTGTVDYGCHILPKKYNPFPTQETLDQDPELKRRVDASMSRIERDYGSIASKFSFENDATLYEGLKDDLRDEIDPNENPSTAINRLSNKEIYPHSQSKDFSSINAFSEQLKRSPSDQKRALARLLIKSTEKIPENPKPTILDLSVLNTINIGSKFSDSPLSDRPLEPQDKLHLAKLCLFSDITGPELRRRNIILAQNAIENTIKEKLESLHNEDLRIEQNKVKLSIDNLTNNN